MRIGELADRCGVTTKTIRYYESIDLLADPDRTSSGYRDYGEGAVQRLQFIRDAQTSGLALSEIASVLELKSAGERSCEHTAQLLTQHVEAIDVQIGQLKAARKELSVLAKRAQSLDPSSCTDPNRCQVIESGRSHT
ncbi:MAG: MerR family copper efflux transcriptional regulator [Verrucomicrobiales bacterium]|jgi:MerR family copper efflux transcriptional regulator